MFTTKSFVMYFVSRLTFHVSQKSLLIMEVKLLQKNENLTDIRLEAHRYEFGVACAPTGVN
ncbi:hypothetical protein B6I21_08425 [candidate division KSB1 bacterium 4572_119]|nr:MAG: hypothetical protein B6I21_08425 [candidate division KSB1 bacterium 4572_119]